MFHLGAVTSFTPPDWAGSWGGDTGDTWADGYFWVDMVKALERAKFDYLMFADDVTFAELALYAPEHDPMMLMPLLAKHTTSIGLIATGSSDLCPPWLLARTLVTLDHITTGRTGWNIVASSEDGHQRADEFVAVVSQLMGSWEPDALVMDRESNIYVDHTKVHTIDFEGQHFRSRGPLNTLAPPNGRPVYCQAGSSPRGRDFASRHADTIFASVHGLGEMRAYREDIRRRMEQLGRDPDSCKILFEVAPVLGDTEHEARQKRARSTERSTSCLDLVGTPSDVAAEMAQAMESAGGDGFLIAGIGSRRHLTEIVDGLAPELQRLGVARAEYSSCRLRDNLFDF